MDNRYQNDPGLTGLLDEQPIGGLLGGLLGKQLDGGQLGTQPDMGMRARQLANLLQRERGVLDRLQLTGGMEEISNRHINGVMGGGRIGYEFPLEDRAALTLGATGSGYKVSGVTPDEKHMDIRRLLLNGLDATYRKGDSSYGMDVGLNPDKRLMFRYQKIF